MPEDEPVIKITDAKVIIDGKEIKDGDIITFVHNGLIVRQGKIKFDIYPDGTGDFDKWHLGFLIEWHDGSWSTLADLLAKAQKLNWSWFITKTVGGEEHEARNNSA